MAKKQPPTIDEAKAEVLSLSESKAELLNTIASEEEFQAVCERFPSSEEQQYHSNRVSDRRDKVQALDERARELQATIGGLYE